MGNELGHGLFPVIEFRRYQIKEGERANFTAYFDAYSPDVFQQLGAMFLGQFCNRHDPNGFTWMRGFRTLEDRAIINSAFYYGPVWLEHKKRFNGLLVEDTNVLLLKAVRNVPVLPAVDVVREKAGGVIVAIIARGTDTTIFDDYQDIREAGLLVTLDVPNNFPQLPYRTDGPYVVWLGVLPDDKRLTNIKVPDGAELLVLDPTPRSRLRWI